MSSFMEDDGKVLQLGDEVVAINVLGEGHTNIKNEMIRFDWTQHLNEILVFSIDTFIIVGL